MSIYKTVTVNASLSSQQIDGNASVSSRQINDNAQVVTKVKYSAIDDYEDLKNKPKINSVELVGNKMLPELGIDSLSNLDIEKILA